MNNTTPAYRRRWETAGWCALLMLTWGLWLWQLDASDLTFDETATYFVAHRPWKEILVYLQGAVREHPPVYYLLIHGWMTIVGHSEFSLRIFSVGMGLIALPLTGRLTRLLLSERHRREQANVMALLSALFLSITPGMAYYAREARMYSLGVVWTTLATGLFIRDWLVAKTWPPPWAIFSLGVVHFLALFTHYYLLIPVLIQPLALLLARRWKPLLAWCALHAGPLLVALGWVGLSPGLQMTLRDLGSRFDPTFPTLAQVRYLVGKTLFSPVIGIRYPLLDALLTGIAAGLTWEIIRPSQNRAWNRERGTWLAMVTVMTPVAVFLLPHPPAPRYVIYLTVWVAIALTALVTAPARLTLTDKGRWIAIGGVGGLTLAASGLLIAGGLTFAITYDRSHYGKTLARVRAYARPDEGDGVLFYGPWQVIPFHYYDPGGMPPITILPPYAPPHLNPAEAEPVLTRLLQTHRRLWVLPAAVDDVDPSHFAAGWLNTHAHGVWRNRDFSLYLPPLPAEAPARHLDRTYTDIGLTLEQIAYEPQPIPAGEPLRLTLYWWPQRPLEEDVEITLELKDADGHQWDTATVTPGAWGAPPSTWEPTRVFTDYEGLMIPSGAPPGPYQVRLQVLNPTTGQPLQSNGERWTHLVTIQVGEPEHAPVWNDLPGSESGGRTFCAPVGQPCLTLAGYEPGGERFSQGYPLPVTLHWQAPEQALADMPETLPLQMQLQVVHRPWLSLPGRSRPAILTYTVPLLPAYPVADWSPGRLVTWPVVLTLPPDATTGPAQVTLAVLAADGSPWQTPGGQPAEVLFNIVVEGRPVQHRLPAGLTPIRVAFGKEVELRGYRIEGDPRPGGQLHLTYAWYCQAQPTAIYAVFNHLLTADGLPVAQVDGWPQGGRMVSTQWQVGEYIEDTYTLEIPRDAPAGPYVLYVGLYNAANNERQPARQEEQRLPNDQLPIPLP